MKKLDKNKKTGFFAKFTSKVGNGNSDRSSRNPTSSSALSGLSGSVTSLNSTNSRLSSQNPFRNHHNALADSIRKKRKSIRDLERNRQLENANDQTQPQPNLINLENSDIFNPTFSPERLQNLSQSHLQPTLLQSAGLEFTAIEYERTICENEDNILNYVDAKTISPLKRRKFISFFYHYSEDWEFKAETTFLFIRILDKYLSIRADRIKSDKQYFVTGAAALLLSSKFNERYPAMIEDLVDLVPEMKLTSREIMEKEKEIFSILDWKINLPVSYGFTRTYAKWAFINERNLLLPKLTMVRFICEICEFSSDFISDARSRIAAAAILVIYKLRRRGLVIQPDDANLPNLTLKWVLSLMSHTNYE
jgi:hypothetical protein